MKKNKKQKINHQLEIFNQLSKSNNKGKSQTIVFKKKNGFLVSCLADYKINLDQEGNHYLIFVCNFEKETKPKAQILVDSAGTIIGHNSAASVVLNIKGDCLDLRSCGYSEFSSLTSSSGIAYDDIFKLGVASPQNLFLQPDRLMVTDPNNKTKKGFVNQLSITNKNKKEKSSRRSSRRSDFKKKEKLITIKNESFHVTTCYPINSVPDSMLIGLWSYQKFDDGENTPSHIYQPSFTINESRSHNSMKRRPLNTFYFCLNFNFEYLGSFKPKNSSPNSNLNFDKIDKKVKISELSEATQLLHRLKNPNHYQEELCKVNNRVDYGVGIRTKRLNKEGKLVDWYFRIDGEESESEEYSEKLEESNRGKHRTKPYRSAGNRKSSTILTRRKQKGSLNKSKQTLKQTHRKNLFNRNKRGGIFKNSIKSLNSMEKIKTSFKNRRISSPLCFLIFSTLFMNLSFFTNILTSAYSRVIISNDLEFFAQIDYAISFRLADLYNIGSNMIQIAMINNGTDININLDQTDFRGLHPELGASNDQLIQNRLVQIRKSLESFEKFNIETQASIEKITLVDEFNEVLNKKNVEIVKSGVISKFSLMEGIRQVVGSIAFVLNMPHNLITFYDPNVDFVLQNIRLNFLDKLINFNIFANIIKDDVVERQDSSEILIWYSLMGILLVSFLLFYVGVCAYYWSRQVYVETYYGFSSKVVDKLIRKCEKYLEYLRLREIGQQDVLIVSQDSMGSQRRDHSMTSNGGGIDQSNMDLEEYMSHLRRRKRKGSLVPCFGTAHLVLTAFLAILTAFRESTYIYQNRVIRNSVGILETVDKIALSEQWNYAGLIFLEYSMYDFWGVWQGVQKIYSGEGEECSC